jgi:hypothetical protein
MEGRGDSKPIIFAAMSRVCRLLVQFHPPLKEFIEKRKFFEFQREIEIIIKVFLDFYFETFKIVLKCPFFIIFPYGTIRFA